MILPDDLVSQLDADYLMSADYDPVVVASNLGLVCYKPTKHELTLDIDDAAGLERYNNLLPLVQKYLNVTEIKRTVSNGGNTHIYLKLPKGMDVPKRVALQAILGSDPKREALSLLRYFSDKHRDDSLVLFETDPTGSV